MESLKLDGTTIRGLVKGRSVNCIVRSVPDGLVLPPGQYVLRVGENNPIYGLFLAVEAAPAPGSAASINFIKTAPSGLKDSPASALKYTPASALKYSPAAVATLVPTTKPAYSAIIKEVPGFKSVSFRDVASSKVDAPAALKYAPASKVDAPAALKYAPASKVDAPAAKLDAPAALKYAPASKVDAPASKIDAPAIKAVDAPALKLDFVPGQGLTARVIIAIRPIGQNCLVAQAGFSDLLDVVQQAGGVGLIVA